jgi:hypothetical protein
MISPEKYQQSIGLAPLPCSSAATTAEAFYRRLLEQICEDPRRTRARRLAESGLLFWDAMQEEAAKNVAQTNAGDVPRAAQKD